MTAEELEQEIAERANDYWYQEGEPEMRRPRATAVGLTEREACWLWDYVMHHTGFAAYGQDYETVKRELRHRLTVVGMRQQELADLIRRMRGA